MNAQKPIEMVVHTDDHYFPCHVLHMTERGVLARLLSGESTDLYEGEEGTCLLNYQEEDFEGACQVMRIVRDVVALTFSDLDTPQQSFIQRVAEKYNAVLSRGPGKPEAKGRQVSYNGR